MFDIGFFELLMVAVVGLLVIGPERLPGAVRTGSLWVGRLKRSLRETRTNFEQQIGADDIRRQLHNEEVMHSLQQSYNEMTQRVDSEIADIETAVKISADPTPYDGDLPTDIKHNICNTHSDRPQPDASQTTESKS